MKRKSVREVLENPQPNEYYVLVTRYYPMEFRKKGLKLSQTPINDWDRDVAPSKELLENFKNIGLWLEYVKRFKQEVPLVLAKRKAQIWKEDAKQKEVVLVCIEEDNKYPKCHTWLLLEMLQKS